MSDDLPRNRLTKSGDKPGFSLRTGPDCELVAEQHEGPLSLLVIRRTDLNTEENTE